MQIKHIKLWNVMSHDRTTLLLPDKGIVVLCGSNGAGKSTFIEAPAYALSGETLRGTLPFRPDTEGSIEVVTSSGTILRSVTATGTKKVAWSPSIGALQKADTNTKTNDQIVQAFGDFDVWRRTHVFSSTDAANFTMATDAERKRLIEQLLGLERFDEASKVLHGQLNDARKELLTRQYRRDADKQAVAQVYALLKAHDAAKPELSLPPPATAPVLNIRELEDELDDVRHLLGVKNHQVAQLQENQRRAVSEESPMYAKTLAVCQEQEIAVRVLEQELVLALAGQCPTCKSPYSGDLELIRIAEAEAREKLYSLREQVRLSVDEKLETVTTVDSLLKAASAEVRALQTRERQLELDLQRTRMEQEAFERHEQHCAALRQQHATALAVWAKRGVEIGSPDKLEAEAQASEHKFFEQEALVAELVVCDQVLGLKGVRVSVLARALEATEQLANISLAQMGSGIRVQLKSFSETKKGTLNSNISIEVVGAGAGYGYKASSGGERRRVDAALLLAFAEVAEASFGRSGGTLFLDEVFDALDAEGCSGIVDVLVDLAQRRCLVVITHRHELAWMLQQAGAHAYQVEKGKLDAL